MFDNKKWQDKEKRQERDTNKRTEEEEREEDGLATNFLKIYGLHRQ